MIISDKLRSIIVTHLAAWPAGPFLLTNNVRPKVKWETDLGLQTSAYVKFILEPKQICWKGNKRPRIRCCSYHFVFVFVY
jgi:hypothetical protein